MFGSTVFHRIMVFGSQTWRCQYMTTVLQQIGDDGWKQSSSKITRLNYLMLTAQSLRYHVFKISLNIKETFSLTIFQNQHNIFVHWMHLSCKLHAQWDSRETCKLMLCAHLVNMMITICSNWIPQQSLVDRQLCKNCTRSANKNIMSTSDQ